jgi:type IV pilus assembly protein PilC
VRFAKKRLIWLCHSMATMLDAGLPINRVLEVLQRQASGRMAAALGGVAGRIEAGQSLTEGMRAERGFPDLLVDMVEVGEASGTLDCTLAEAGRYYEFVRGLVRRLLSRIAWPVAQYILAVAVVGVAFTILAGLGQPMGNPALVLALGYGLPAVGLLGYFFLLRPLGRQRIFHEALLRMPLVRSASRSLALARFSLLMHLMSEAGVPVLEALPRALRGTGNGAYAARAGKVTAALKQGSTLTEALGQTQLFPEDYLAMVVVAEESGKLTERFDGLARQYAERAEAALSGLTHVLSALIWILVAVVIVGFIFFFASNYISGLQRGMG